MLASAMLAASIFLSTPSARRATAIKAYSYAKDGFLSTPSARRATPPGQVQQIRHVDFYPRPPRGGRQHIDELREIAVEISIHALREEGDMPI